MAKMVRWLPVAGFRNFVSLGGWLPRCRGGVPGRSVERPTTGGITQARQRLGAEPPKEVFAEVAVPVAAELTRGRSLGRGG